MTAAEAEVCTARRIRLAGCFGAKRFFMIRNKMLLLFTAGCAII